MTVVTISQEELDELHKELSIANASKAALLEELEKKEDEYAEILEAKDQRIEKLQTDLAEAKKYTHLPHSVRMEKIGSRTKIFCAVTGLQLFGYAKAKYDFADGKGAQATITFDASITNCEFKKPQLSLLDEPEPEGGETPPAEEGVAVEECPPEGVDAPSEETQPVAN